MRSTYNTDDIFVVTEGKITSKTTVEIRQKLQFTKKNEVAELAPHTKQYGNAIFSPTKKLDVFLIPSIKAIVV